MVNSRENLEVTVLFGEPDINLLFSELLRTRGVTTSIVDSPAAVNPSTKVITEPQFYSRLNPEIQKHCLVVGNKDALREVHALSLSRPLTEEKIEEALSKFLS